MKAKTNTDKWLTECTIYLNGEDITRFCIGIDTDGGIAYCIPTGPDGNPLVGYGAMSHEERKGVIRVVINPDSSPSAYWAYQKALDEQ